MNESHQHSIDLDCVNQYNTCKAVQFYTNAPFMPRANKVEAKKKKKKNRNKEIEKFIKAEKPKKDKTKRKRRNQSMEVPRNFLPYITN